MPGSPHPCDHRFPMITPSHTHTDAQDPRCAALLVSRLTRTQKAPSALLPTGAPGAEGQCWPTDHGQDTAARLHSGGGPDPFPGHSRTAPGPGDPLRPGRGPEARPLEYTPPAAHGALMALGRSAPSLLSRKWRSAASSAGAGCRSPSAEGEAPLPSALGRGAGQTGPAAGP